MWRLKSLGVNTGSRGVEKHDLGCCHMRPRGAWAQEDPAKTRQEEGAVPHGDCDMTGQGVGRFSQGDDGFARGNTWLALAAWRHAGCQQWLDPQTLIESGK